jgi:hypothetical protein
MKSRRVTSGDFIFTMICAGVKQLKIQINDLYSHLNKGLQTSRKYFANVNSYPPKGASGYAGRDT